jgi:hypothetical protein
MQQSLIVKSVWKERLARAWPAKGKANGNDQS